MRGGGREVKELKRKNCKITAIDLDKDMIEQSKRIEPNAEYIEGDFLNFRRKNYYDYIVCLFNTVNYLDKAQRIELINLAFYNLKKGGQLIINTVDLSYNPLRLLLSNLKHHSMYYYFPQESRLWFKDVNFRKIEIVKVETSKLIVAKK